MNFDAHGATGATTPITSYSWQFGDGTTASTTGPSVSHTYADVACYTATLTVTDTAGTSTTQVFTGQTMSRDGGPQAQKSHQVCAGTPPFLLQFYCSFNCLLPPGPGEFIWPAGDLKPGDQVGLRAVLTDQQGAPLAGHKVTLALRTTSGAGAAVGNTALTAHAQTFVTDAKGGIDLSYTSSLEPPVVGQDALVAKASLKGFTATSTDRYTYTVPTDYRITPSPMATAGSLKAGQRVTVTLRVTNHSTQTSVGVGGAQVYLSFAKNGLGGTAATDGQALAGQPIPVLTDLHGQVAVTYTAGSGVGSADVIQAEDAASAPTIQATDSYSDP